MFKLEVSSVQLETGWTDRDEVKERNNAPIKGNNLYMLDVKNRFMLK
jgi:hypothetical protein